MHVVSTHSAAITLDIALQTPRAESPRPRLCRRQSRRDGRRVTGDILPLHAAGAQRRAVIAAYKQGAT